MKRLLALVLPCLLLAGAFASPVNASNPKPANASAHWRLVSSEVLRYAREAERSNYPMTQGMDVRGLTKAAQKLVKSPAAKKRATNKAKTLCRAVAAPGQAGIERAARVWSNQTSAFVAGIDLSAPISRQHAWELNSFLDIAAQSYASVFCPEQEDRLSAASDLSASWAAASGQPGAPSTSSAVPLDSLAEVKFGTCGWKAALAVNVSVEEDATAQGIKSHLIVGGLAVGQCGMSSSNGDWKRIRGEVAYKGKTYPAYIQPARFGGGLSSVYAAVNIPPVKNFHNEATPRPTRGGKVAILTTLGAGNGQHVVVDGAWENPPRELRTSAVIGIYEGAPIFDAEGFLVGLVSNTSVISDPDGKATAQKIFSDDIQRFCDDVAACIFLWKQ